MEAKTEKMNKDIEETWASNITDNLLQEDGEDYKTVTTTRSPQASPVQSPYRSTPNPSLEIYQ